jgi:two-component system response regulator MprA
MSRTAVPERRSGHSDRIMGEVQILVVDDNAAVRDSLRRSLTFEGYDVRTAGDGLEALDAAQEHMPDAIVLDLQMPRLDGLETCRRLRARGDDVPVLMLTARDGTRDRVTGLDVGADDYLPKPFALEELLARLRALLRRSGARAGAQRTLQFADVTMDTGTREVARAGVALTLTRTEHSLLELFLLNPRQVLSRAQILHDVWGYEHDTGSNTLDVYIGYLRHKMEDRGGPRLLHNVRGVGYALRETGASVAADA